MSRLLTSLDAPPSGRARPVWFDAAAYGRARLLGGGDVPWPSPAELSSFFAKIGAMFRSDAILVDLATWSLSGLLPTSSSAPRWRPEPTRLCPADAARRRAGPRHRGGGGTGAGRHERGRPAGAERAHARPVAGGGTLGASDSPLVAAGAFMSFLRLSIAFYECKNHALWPIKPGMATKVFLIIWRAGF